MTKEKNKLLVAIALLLATTAVFAVRSIASAQTATSTNTSSTALGVVCAGTATGNMITWTATPNGGTAPYTYLWSGSEVDGNVTSTVIAGYPANGTYTSTIAITDADANTASSTCSADVTGMPTGTTPTPTSTLPIADLTIAQSVDNTTPSVGSMINYTLTVTANGPATSTGAMATDLLPTGISFVSATPTMGTYQSSSGLWTIGDMTPSSTAMLTIGATVASGTENQIISNSATVGESSTVMNLDATTSAATVITVASSTGNSTSTGGGSGGTTSTSTPLSVSCDWGYDTPNTITWVASASGGTAPYTYSWSGNQIQNATASSVTETYPKTGTYDAMVNVTDAANQTGTASCSASVNSTAPPPTVPTSTPPVPPGITIQPTLTIGPNGSFLGHGMIVTAIASTSIQAQIWGITYTISWPGRLPQFLFRTGNDNTEWIPSVQLNVGDQIGVSGFVSPSNPLVVTSDVIRDYAILGPRPPHPFLFGSTGNGGDEDDNGSGTTTTIGTGTSTATSTTGNSSSSNYFENQLNNLFSQLQNLQNLFHNTFNR
jgi:uncharacterized repeat protein (TIGR01451 family)